MTKEERYAAKMAVVDWISKGFNRATIRRMIEIKFGLRGYDSQLKLHKEAMEVLAKSYDRNDIRLTNNERIEGIIQKSLNPNNDTDVYADPHLAIKAMDLQHKLHGLYHPEKESTVNINAENIVVKFGE